MSVKAAIQNYDWKGRTDFHGWKDSSIVLSTIFSVKISDGFSRFLANDLCESSVHESDRFIDLTGKI